MSELPRQPSPYVSVYMARRQAEHAVRAMRAQAEGKAQSHPLWAAIRRFEQAIAKNAGG